MRLVVPVAIPTIPVCELVGYSDGGRMFTGVPVRVELGPNECVVVQRQGTYSCVRIHEHGADGVMMVTTLNIVGDD